MKIEWNENPLCTKVHLDEQSLEFIKIAVRQDAAYSALIRLSIKFEEYNFGDAKEILKKFFDRDDADNYHEEIETYKLALLEDHDGDCICVPMSCHKCRAEEMLGLSTIEGLRKHPANYINNAFQDGRNIDQALDYLKNYKAKADERMKEIYPDTWQEWEMSWEKDAQRAYKWLSRYKEEKLT